MIEGKTIHYDYSNGNDNDKSLFPTLMDEVDNNNVSIQRAIEIATGSNITIDRKIR